MEWFNVEDSSKWFLDGAGPEIILIGIDPEPDDGTIHALFQIRGSEEQCGVRGKCTHPLKAEEVIRLMGRNANTLAWYRAKEKRDGR